jgi:hypothetical protein
MNLKELGDLMQLLFVKDLLKKKTEQANEMTTELLIRMILKQLMIRPM